MYIHPPRLQAIKFHIIMYLVLKYTQQLYSNLYIYTYMYKLYIRVNF